MLLDVSKISFYYFERYLTNKHKMVKFDDLELCLLVIQRTRVMELVVKSKCPNE